MGVLAPLSVAQAAAGERGYELVSPVDKSFSDIAETSSRIRATPSGDRVGFVSTGAFGDAQGTGAVAQYLARRGSGGWETKAITPRQQTGPGSSGNSTIYYDFTTDLGLGLTLVTNPPPVPTPTPDTQNLYVREDATGAFRLVTSLAPPVPDSGYAPIYAAASSDFSHVLFESNRALTPDATDDGLRKLYESVDGTVRLAGILPDGRVSTDETIAGVGASRGPTGGSLDPSQAETSRTISDDGSVVFFTAVPTPESGNGQIYARIDGTRTVHVTRSQRAVPDPGGTRPATFAGASQDGRTVYFTTTEQLLDADANGAADLYRFDTMDGGLTLVSVDSEPADGTNAIVQGVLGLSDDGDTIYFAAFGRLTLDARDLPAAPKLYQWHAGRLTYVSELSGADSTLWGGEYGTGRLVRVSSDGSAILFVSLESLNGYDNGGLFVGQVYLYRSGDAGPRCLSCMPSGTANVTDSSISSAASGIAGGTVGYEPRTLLNDGSQAYFMTANPLVSEDVNGKVDVYEYRPGTAELQLISSGTSAANSYFGDASEDGEDVFFVTRDRLSPRDRDSNLDLYNARVGAQNETPPPPGPTPCIGDECQGLPNVTPQLEPLPSGDADGSDGNLIEQPAAPKPSVRIVALGRGARSQLARSGRVVLRVRVSGAGQLLVTASTRVRALTATVARKTVRTKRAAVVRVTLRLARSARQALGRRGRHRVRFDAMLSSRGDNAVGAMTVTVEGRR
ncbi:hypothetical protein [Conexibacter woesei]|uniref:hypothetical protein n=1 Tax=Conexibacter woesei TaxID=191495 RepID=UPI0011D1D02B|nr:hypothetical protein [Conexibacter woesei]